jgi:hypothetical protein
MPPATAALDHRRKNARMVADRATRYPTPANLKLSASLTAMVAESDASLAEMVEADEFPLQPARVVTFVESSGWTAESLAYHGRYDIGMPVLTTHGHHTEEDALLELVRLAQHPNIAVPAAPSTYRGVRTRAARNAALGESLSPSIS